MVNSFRQVAGSSSAVQISVCLFLLLSIALFRPTRKPFRLKADHYTGKVTSICTSNYTSIIAGKGRWLAPPAGTFKDIPPGLGGGPKFQRAGSGPVPLPVAASPPLQLLPTKKPPVIVAASVHVTMRNIR